MNELLVSLFCFYLWETSYPLISWQLIFELLHDVVYFRSLFCDGFLLLQTILTITNHTTPREREREREREEEEG